MNKIDTIILGLIILHMLIQPKLWIERNEAGFRVNVLLFILAINLFIWSTVLAENLKI